jgi:uncharacterized protein (DUF1499 family)
MRAGRRLAVAGAVILLLVAGGWYGWQLGPWGDQGGSYAEIIEFATLEREPVPHQFLIAPAGATPKAEPDAESPAFAVPPERLRDAFLAVIAEQPRTHVLARSADGLRFTVVQRSLVMRFPDYVGVGILPAGEEGSTLAVYSRSRFGYSDMGVNRARVESWINALRRKVAA